VTDYNATVVTKRVEIMGYWLDMPVCANCGSGPIDDGQNRCDDCCLQLTTTMADAKEQTDD